MGKIILAFLFFLAASTLAIREARPLRAPEPLPARIAPPPADEAPSRALRDLVPPPWVRLAPPPEATVAAARVIEPTAVEPPVAVADNDSGDDVPDLIDRCPDQPEDNADDDGCPEPVNGPVVHRIIRLDVIY